MTRPVTVVVVSHDRAAVLPACLDAVLGSHHPDFDVLVVDTGSTDGSLELLAYRYPHVAVERAPGLSPGAALNRAFARAGRRDVVRIAADAVPDGTDWLRRLEAAVETTPRAGIVGVRLVLASGRIASLGRRVVCGLGLDHQGVDEGAQEQDGDRPAALREVDTVRGACAWYRRALIDRVRFDEACDPATGGDDDFCLRARWHGFDVFVAPAVRVVTFVPCRAPTTRTDAWPRPALLDAWLDGDAAQRRAFSDWFAARWGVDPTAPDLNEIRRRYGDTRVCWRIGERMRYRDLGAAPAVDVAFVTCNSAHLLPRMLDALLATDWPDLRVQVVDNGSRDGSIELLRRAAAAARFPFDVQVLATNVGIAPALNLAFLAGSAPLVARLDDDTIVEPDWLRRMVPRFGQRPFAGVVAPKVLHDRDGAFVQAHPHRHWPHGIEPGDARDVGQWDQLARVVSARGCCNLYRRDVLDEIGLLDVRYAPSQYDEWDHHIAATVAGYEILFDGTACVRHLLVAGRSQTHSGFSNSRSNGAKVLGKWGYDLWQRLDRGIDLSREGRFLPLDGDTRALLAKAPPPAPPGERRCEREAAVLRAATEQARRRRVEIGAVLQAMLPRVVAQGEVLLDAGNREVAAVLGGMLVDAFPGDRGVLLLCARLAEADGDFARGGWFRRHAASMWPRAENSADEEATAIVPRPTATASRSVITRTHTASGEPDGHLLLAPLAGGPELRDWVATEALARRSAGHRVAIAAHPDAEAVGSARRIEAFGLGAGAHLLDLVKAARAAAPSVEVLLHPCLGDDAEGAWTARVLPQIFADGTPDARIDTLLAGAASGKLSIDGRTERRLVVDEPAWLLRYQREVLACCDTIVVHDAEEIAWLRERFGRLPACRLEPWPDPAPGLPDDRGAAFRAMPAAPRRGFVLLTGALVPEHGHLFALHVLRGLDLVVAGAARQPDYLDLCRRVAGPKARFLPLDEPEDLASAMRAAAAVVHPTSVARPTAEVALARACRVPVVCRDGAIARGLGDLALPFAAFDAGGLLAATREAISRAMTARASTREAAAPAASASPSGAGR